MKYLVGRDNLAVTVFVPYDCPNNCPFCTSKHEYRHNENFSMEAILESLKTVLTLSAVKDIVITGGEPFANLKLLNEILEAIKVFDARNYTSHNVFINTTLPTTAENAKTLEAFIVAAYKRRLFTGLNVSRHILFRTNLENDKLIRHLCSRGISVRINSVVIGRETVEQLEDFIDKYNFVNQINFRADYRNIITQDDLRGYNNVTLQNLFQLEYYNYASSTGCHVCNTDKFIPEYHDDPIVCLHRGMEHSKLVVVDGAIEEVNDIIIKQDGRILFDWDEDGSRDIAELDWSTFHDNEYNKDDEDDDDYGYSGGHSYPSCGFSFGSCGVRNGC